MKQRAMAIAIALAMSMTAALSALPVAAVSPDCTKDFDIADSKSAAQTRPLDPTEEETGVEDVTPTGCNETVKVKLTSDDDVLEFGIFEDSNGCDRSDNVSPSVCLDDVELNTTGSQSQASQKCTLESSLVETREFYFVMKNLQNSDSLEYEIHVVS